MAVVTCNTPPRFRLALRWPRETCASREQRERMLAARQVPAALHRDLGLTDVAETRPADRLGRSVLWRTFF